MSVILFVVSYFLQMLIHPTKTREKGESHWVFSSFLTSDLLSACCEIRDATQQLKRCCWCTFSVPKVCPRSGEGATGYITWKGLSRSTLHFAKQLKLLLRRQKGQLILSGHSSLSEGCRSSSCYRWLLPIGHRVWCACRGEPINLHFPMKVKCERWRRKEYNLDEGMKQKKATY